MHENPAVPPTLTRRVALRARFSCNIRLILHFGKASPRATSPNGGFSRAAESLPGRPRAGIFAPVRYILAQMPPRVNLYNMQTEILSAY